jgi:hypothetical protein
LEQQNQAKSKNIGARLKYQQMHKIPTSHENEKFWRKTSAENFGGKLLRKTLAEKFGTSQI